ncbi:alkaline phosphatase family protein [Tautonia marina]|uniref:alkaline phosphatase family protein n=1 Tax=Tautonia marina TaxID=2653855 RepID=UPI00126069BE|nr:alkaline phosphatase family protein [Tautonia marina]
MSAPSDRVLILGLDGATWSVIDPMRRRGVMPNLDALLARSARGTLRSSEPPMTAAAWTTMQTGCDPADHGIFDHRYFDPASNMMRVNHSGRFRVPTLWQLLDRAGRSVISLNLPGTYPAPKVRGIVVSGMDAPHLEAALSGAPADFAAALRQDVPRYGLKYQWKRVPESLDELKANARDTTEGFLGRAEGAVLADRMMPDWSALMVQFQNLDPFQHRAWRFLNVDETGIDRPDWNDAAAEVLRGLDRAIGLLCELADRRGAVILCVSDHGFGPCLGRIHVNRILVDQGLITLPGFGGRMRRRATQAIDRVRLWSDKRRDPNARGASFHASIAASYPFDWSRTVAFAPHQDCGAMVYIPRTGRPGGPLPSTPRQIDEVRQQTRAVLAEARHPDTGNPLFPKVIDLGADYQLDPSEFGYPDLLALPDENYWVRTKLTSDRSWVAADPSLPGTHRPEGIVSLCAPGVQTDRALDANLRDVAPSVLAMLGEPIPEHIRGVPFAGLDARSVRTDAASEPVKPPHASSFDFDPEDEAIVEQRLIDLGYLG